MYRIEVRINDQWFVRECGFEERANELFNKIEVSGPIMGKRLRFESVTLILEM